MIALLVPSAVVNIVAASMPSPSGSWRSNVLVRLDPWARTPASREKTALVFTSMISHTCSAPTP